MVERNERCIKPSELYQENIRLREFKEVLGDLKLDAVEEIKSKSTVKRCCRSNCCFRSVFGILIILVLLLSIFAIYTQLNSSTFLKKDAVVAKTGRSTSENKDNKKVGICLENQEKKSFPDFDYAIYGYNIIYGYPLATGHDPGLTHPIFEADYSNFKQTADCRYQVPRGYHLIPDVACVTSFTSQTVKDASQFSKHLSVSAEASGGGWGVSFSASSEYKKKTSVMSASESVFIFSKAMCNYYFAKLDQQSPPPLSTDFIDYVKSIKNESDTHDFFDYYGTHFMTYTLFGARFVYEHKMSQKSFQQESSEEVSVSAKASYSGVFSFSAGFGMSSANTKAAQNFLSKVETKTISIGAPPPANGDTMTWASTVKETPIPVKYKLESIENLFTHRYMKNYDVDYQRIRKFIKLGKKSYCRSLKAKGVVDGCKIFSEYLTFHGLSISGGNWFNYNENQCIERCVEDNGCIAVNYHDGCCYVHRRSNQNFTAEAATINTQSKVMISFEALKLLSYSMRLQNARIKDGIPTRSSSAEHNESMCMEKCKSDPICFVFTYNESENEDFAINCWLYSLDKVSCRRVSDEKKCNTISVEPNFVTWFNTCAI